MSEDKKEGSKETPQAPAKTAASPPANGAASGAGAVAQKPAAAASQAAAPAEKKVEPAPPVEKLEKAVSDEEFEKALNEPDGSKVTEADLDALDKAEFDGKTLAEYKAAARVEHQGTIDALRNISKLMKYVNSDVPDDHIIWGVAGGAAVLTIRDLRAIARAVDTAEIDVSP